MIDALTIATRLLDLYEGRYSAIGSLILIATSFLTALLIGKSILLFIEKIAFRRPLPWSGTMLSLLAASVFWSSISLFVVSLLLNVAGRPTILNSPEGLPTMMLISLSLPLLFAPFSGLLGFPMLLLYLFRPATPRAILIASVVVTMTTSYAFDLYIDRNPGS